MVERGEVDVAIVVTDALLVAKSKNRRVELIGTYVQSALVWAIAGPSSRRYPCMDDLISSFRPPQGLNHEDSPCLRIGVSRMGSGSHSMGLFLCNKFRLVLDKVRFVVAQNIDGLVAGKNCWNVMLNSLLRLFIYCVVYTLYMLCVNVCG